MKGLTLFYSPIERKYYSIDKFVCNHCNKDIKEIMVYVFLWDTKQSELNSYCQKCWGRIKSYAKVTEYKFVLLCNPPIESRPLFIRPPAIQDGKEVSVVEAAFLPSDNVTDNTIHAGRESLEGAKIGNLGYKKHNKEENKNLTQKEAKLLLDDIKDRKKIIPKQLE